MDLREFLDIAANIFEIVAGLGLVIGAVIYVAVKLISRIHVENNPDDQTAINTSQTAQTLAYAIFGIVGVAALLLLLITIFNSSSAGTIPITPTPAQFATRRPSATFVPSATPLPPTKAPTLVPPTPAPTATTAPLAQSVEENQPSVLVEYPTDKDISNFDDNRIWSYVYTMPEGKKGYRIVYSPGKFEYTLDVSEQDRYRFGFIWCENTAAMQDHALTIISRPQFYIDGEEINDRDMLSGQMMKDNMYCTHYSTMLTEWKKGSQIELEMSYTIKELLEEPGTDFQPGEYRHVIYVSVK